MKSSDYFEKSKRAAGKALNLAKLATGTTKDKNLAIYDKLQPVHFDAIASVYGEDGLLRYIKTMEAERMKNATNVH